MEISYCTLKQKEVVNISDGKNFGNPTDLIIDINCGKILGIIVPSCKNFFNIFKNNNDIYIPYNRVCKIGKDIILVDIYLNNKCLTKTTTIQNDNDYKNNKLKNDSYDGTNDNIK